MIRSASLLTALFSIISANAHADDVPATEGPATTAVASGLTIQTSMATSIDVIGAASGAPAFLIGSRSDRLFIGAGVGLTLAAFSYDDDETLRGRALTFAPAFQYDFWTSTDGRVRGALSGSVGIGHARFSDEYESYGSFDDEPTITKDYAQATFLPVRVGLGGDYYVHRNFAVGTEFGVRGAALLASSTDSNSSPEANFSYQAFYGSIRLSVILGD